MSVNPINSYITSFDALYYTKAEVQDVVTSLSSLSLTFNNLTASTITLNPVSGVFQGGALFSTTNMFVSSINGSKYPNALVTSGTNSGTVSAKPIPPNVWTPLASTPTQFAFLAGKVYDISMPFGGNLTAAPADSAASISFGIGLNNVATPATSYTIHTTAGQTQTLVNGLLNATISPAADVTSPLVSYMISQGASSNATITAQGQALSNTDLIKIHQLN